MYAQPKIWLYFIRDLGKGNLKFPVASPPVRERVKRGRLMTRTRRKESARRTRRLIVRVSDEKQARVRAGAAKAGLRVSEYVRRMAVDGRIVVRRDSAYGMSLASQLKRVGVNINQLMPIAHLNGEIPPDLVRLWGKLEGILDRIIQMQ